MNNDIRWKQQSNIESLNGETRQRMARFYDYLPDQEIVVTLSQLLSWSHFIELMDLEPDNIHNAEYWLQLPPKVVLKAKLHKAMVEAKTRIAFHRGKSSD